LGIALASPAPTLAVGSVDLDDAHRLAEQHAGQPRAIGACALDADELELAEAVQPREQPAVAGGGGRERLDAEEAAGLVERGGDVHIQMGVSTPAVIRSGKVVIVIPSLASGWVAPHLPGRRTGQRRASKAGSSRSLRPTGGCRVAARTRPTDRLEDNPARERQPVELGQTRFEQPPER
jgi:hypothetical protein